MTRQNPGRQPRVWALLGARAGDNDQVRALAEAIGLPFEIKRLEFNHLRLLGPRLLGSSLASLTAGSRTSVSREAAPDLTISVGHRSVSAVQWLRRSCPGLRSIHVGFPRISPGRFDLVIATPQYPIPDHPNLLRIPYALTRGVKAAPAKEDQAVLAQFPSPRRLLLIGGPSLYWQLDNQRLTRRLADLLAEAEKDGGSVLVSTSPRTPAPVQAQVEAIIAASTAPALLAKPGQAPAYQSLLASADSIRVTADSVAMVSDAIWSGKPVATVPVRESLAGRSVLAALDRVSAGHPVYPRDLRFFWRGLAAVGIGERLAVPRVSLDEQRRTILARVDEVLAPLRKAVNG